MSILHYCYYNIIKEHTPSFSLYKLSAAYIIVSIIMHVLIDLYEINSDLGIKDYIAKRQIIASVCMYVRVFVGGGWGRGRRRGWTRCVADKSHESQIMRPLIQLTLLLLPTPLIQYERR